MAHDDGVLRSCTHTFNSFRCTYHKVHEFLPICSKEVAHFELPSYVIKTYLLALLISIMTVYCPAFVIGFPSMVSTPVAMHRQRIWVRLFIELWYAPWLPLWTRPWSDKIAKAPTTLSNAHWFTRLLERSLGAGLALSLSHSTGIGHGRFVALFFFSLFNILPTFKRHGR